MSRSTTPTSPNGRKRHPAGPQTTPADVADQDQRDGRGRFTRGNAGGPGNPFARQVAALRSALIEAVTPDDIRAIALELLTQAKVGNLAALKLLLSYVIGQPTVAPNPDALEVDEWQLRQQAPTAAEATETLFERRPPGLVNAAARAMTIVHQHEFLDLLEPNTPPPEADTKRVEAGLAERSGGTGEPSSLTSLLQAVVGQLRHETAPTTVTNRDVAAPEDETADRLHLLEALFRDLAGPVSMPGQSGNQDEGSNGERDGRWRTSE